MIYDPDDLDDAQNLCTVWPHHDVIELTEAIANARRYAAKHPAKAKRRGHDAAEAELRRISFILAARRSPPVPLNGF